MADGTTNISQQLTGTIISLQETINNVRNGIEKSRQEVIFDPTQPIGHLLDNTDSSTILSLAKPTSETTSELHTLTEKLTFLQTTLTSRNQWLPTPTATPEAIPCTAAFLDLSDLSTAVSLIADIVQYSNPSTALTPQKALAGKSWTWDPIWREFFAHDEVTSTSTYLSRWFFDPRLEVWRHANMADSGLLPDEAQMRLGAWEDWTWDAGYGEWGLDVACELEEGLEDGARLWIFASRWQERGGGWVYVGGSGG